MKTTIPNWSVAIFAARETAETLSRCIRAALAACSGHRPVIDVLVNGNRELAQAIADGGWGKLAVPDGRVRIWSIAAGDKAHVWNEYLRRIWPVGRTALFIDGYARMRADALAPLEERLERPGAWRGNDKSQMLKTGGPYGNMHAISAQDMAMLRTSGFRLPVGFYRGDSLIGAVLAFGLEAGTDARDRTLNSLRPQARRVLPQAAGSRGVAPLRRRMSDRQGGKAGAPAAQPLCPHGAFRRKTDRDWPAVWMPPELVAVSGQGVAARAHTL